MKKLLILFSCVLFAHGAFAWGQKGHDVTAYIALSIFSAASGVR